MADELKTDLSNCLPIIRHPSTGSGDCSGLDNAKIRAGQTSDWELPAGAFQVKNPPQNYWQDEVTLLFLTLADLELIELA